MNYSQNGRPLDGDGDTVTCTAGHEHHFDTHGAPNVEGWVADDYDADGSPTWECCFPENIASDNPCPAHVIITKE